MNDWLSTRKTLILIAVLVLILLILLLVNTLPTPPKKGPVFPGDEISPAFKSKIGETSDNEISSDPDLLKKEIVGNKTVYTFKSRPDIIRNIVITEGGKAAFEKGTIVKSPSALPFYSDYVNQYGQPEAEFSGSKSHGKFEKTYIYASLGFTLKVNPFTNEVDEVQKFTPTGVDEYLKKWGDDISEDVSTKEEFKQE